MPTLAERNGDFSDLGPGRDGAFGTGDDPVRRSRHRLGFPGGKIPASRIDPNSRKLIDLYPLPNFVGPGAINYTSAAASRQNHRSEMMRIDHIFNDSFTLYGRYTQDGLSLWNPYGGTAITAVTTRFPGLAVTDGIRPGKNFVLNGTHMIRPHPHAAVPVHLGPAHHRRARRIGDSPTARRSGSRCPSCSRRTTAT